MVSDKKTIINKGLSLVILAAVALTLILSSVVMLFVLSAGLERDSHNLELDILKTKKVFLKNQVERTIQEIIIHEALYLEEMKDSSKSYMDHLFRDLAYFTDDSDSLELSLIDYLMETDSEETLTEVIILDQENQIVYQSESDEILLDAKRQNPTYIKADIGDTNFTVVCYVPTSLYMSRLKDHLKNTIREIQYEGGGYIWINEVINYAGGDDYAIRLVHRNLVDTEGEFLSTSIEDIKGNTPYQTELDGINRDGEIFFQYYFKRGDSDEISRKQSYAKLYEPYNWIIATGIHLDDVEAIVLDEQLKLKKVFFQQTIMFIVLFFLGFVILISLYIVNYRSSKIIQENKDLEDRVKERTYELEVLNTGLEEEIEERERIELKLQEAVERIHKSSQAKSEFLANMSHEIRTPINAIIGFNHLLSKMDMTEKQRSYIEKSSQSSKHLLGIIENILDVSKIEANQLVVHRGPFNFYELLNQVYDALMLRAYEKGLSFRYDLDVKVPEWFIGDGERLYQVILNILTNAVKFTDHGYVQVDAFYDEDREFLTLKVKDTGIGIAKENISRLFEPFVQGDESINKQYEGTGLGLNISTKLLNLMGGDIHLESELGVGSVFTIELPLESKSSLNVLSYKDLKVCTVSTLLDQTILYKQLSKMVTSVDVYADVEEMKTEKYDLVFIEYNQNVSDAYEQLDGLKISLDCDNIYYFSRVRSVTTEDILANDGIKGLVYCPMALEEFGTYLFGKGTIEAVRYISKEHQNNKILLVEDNPLNQLIAKELLTGNGYSVVVADHGEEAIELVKQDDYNLILMDIHMPKMNGYDATNFIRQNLKMERIPIIAMTADAMVGIEEKVIESGMNDCVFKPFDVERLLSKIERWTMN